MELYTERHGIRKPIQKNKVINTNVYSALFNCCETYQKNLTHIFFKKCHHDFMDKDYIEFNKEQFILRVKIKIPNLFQNEFGVISTPTDEEKYDQYALLDYIEFFAKNLKDIKEEWNHPMYKNYKTIECFNTDKVFSDFKNKINELFLETGLLYILTNEKIIERVVENTPLTIEIENNINQISENGVKELLKDAIALYKTPTLSARKDSVEKIWDALERLKTYYSTNKKQSILKLIEDMGNSNDEFIKIFNEEFRNLTNIGNNFRIRHHETDKIDITDLRHCDYFFNRCLSLIGLAIQYLK